MNAVFRTAIALSAVMLAGCAATASGPEQQLADSTWALEAFHPANGGADVRPARADQYRLQFLADGTLAAHIDCNRGAGRWQATPAAGQGGSLKLGPLALTRMMCPPDPLGQRLPQELETIQSYRLVQGRLQLELPGNAGSYVWTRIQP